ncbi:MAG: hypothetical protein Q4C32_06355, partial [Eubacteriales bacterium]|nr:hypothetical protein [Eubacteriales bacterium]
MSTGNRQLSNEAANTIKPNPTAEAIYLLWNIFAFIPAYTGAHGAAGALKNRFPFWGSGQITGYRSENYALRTESMWRVRSSILLEKPHSFGE